MSGSAVERNFFCTWEKPYRGVLQGLAGEDRKAGSVQHTVQLTRPEVRRGGIGDWQRQRQTGGLHLQGSRALGAVAPRERRETRPSGPLALWLCGPVALEHTTLTISTRGKIRAYAATREWRGRSEQPNSRRHVSRCQVLACHPALCTGILAARLQVIFILVCLAVSTVTGYTSKTKLENEQKTSMAFPLGELHRRRSTSTAHRPHHTSPARGPAQPNPAAEKRRTGQEKQEEGRKNQRMPSRETPEQTDSHFFSRMHFLEKQRPTSTSCPRHPRQPRLPGPRRF